MEHERKEMKRNFHLGLFFGMLLILLVISCVARGPFSPKDLNPKEQEEYELLKKAGADAEELRIYILYHLTPTLESKRGSIWKEFWDKRYQALNAKEKAVYHALLSESLSGLKYLSLQDEKTRRRFIEKLQDRKRDGLVKTKEGKILYFSLKLLFSKEEMEEFLMLPDSLRKEWLRIWWKKKDPDLTTEINEFKEKFDQRVEHVLIFCHSIFGQKPWDDRGDVHILYGEPDGIEQADYYYLARSGIFIPLDLMTSGNQEIEDMKSRSQVWVYFKHGEFQFQDYHADGYWESAPREKTHEDDTRAMMQFLSTKTEKVEMAKAEIKIDFGKPLDFALGLWKFRNRWDTSKEDTYELAVNFGVPLEKLGVLPDGDSLNCESLIFTEKVTLFDAQSMSLVARDSATIRKEMPKGSNRKGIFFIDQYRDDSLPPGNYIVSVSIRDSVSHKMGVYDTTVLLVPHASMTARNKISPLVMANSTWPADSVYVANNGRKFIRNSMVIVPRPGDVYLEGQLAIYYCELYELKKDQNDSLKVLVVYYVLYRTKNGEFALYAKSDSVYASWPADSQPFLKGTLNLPKGEYILHIIVYDLNDPEAKKEEVRETAAGFIID
jgi:GWxTD domain-containing protein